MIRVQNDDFGRILHSLLYNRFYTFCVKYTPEATAQPIVEGWLDRLYKGDPSLHVLINMDASSIIEHAIIEVQPIVGTVNGQSTVIDRIVVCHQCERDKPNMDTLTEGIEYIDKLAETVGASAKIIFVSHGARAIAKKFHYTSVREMLVKYVDTDDRHISPSS